MGNTWNPLDKAKNDRNRRSGNEHRDNQAFKILSSILSEKLTTSFIGALYFFEENFGYLWGNKKPISKLTEEEKEYRKIWEDVRKQVLDKGNAQKRAVERELKNYEVTQKKIKSNNGGNVNGNR